VAQELKALSDRLEKRHGSAKAKALELKNALAGKNFADATGLLKDLEAVI